MTQVSRFTAYFFLEQRRGGPPGKKESQTTFVTWLFDRLITGYFFNQVLFTVSPAIND